MKVTFNNDRGARSLADLAPGESALVRAIDLEPDEAAWLRAVGIDEGTHVTLLRRAALGGPLHVRTGSGGEFALHRALARTIGVEGAERAERAPASSPERVRGEATPEPAS